MHREGTPRNTILSAEDLELFAYLLEEEGAVDHGELITPRAPEAATPLSFPQERLWFLDQWDPGNTVYNVPFATRLKGHLRVDAFERSLNEIIRRHEALRTTFVAVDGRPQQIVAPSLAIPLPLIDLRSLPPAAQATEIQRLIAENARHHFDLTRGPLLRADLLRLHAEGSRQEYIFLLSIHHIVFDAWSVGLFLRELTVLYDAFVNDRPSPLPDLVIQYPDFAIWQRGWLQGTMLQEQIAYWKRQLGGTLPILELPSDYPRPPELTSQGSLCSYHLPAALSQQLLVLSQVQGVTLFMTLFAAFQILLYRYTGEEDIITGSAIANRDFVDIEPLMGFFLNTLPLRTDLSSNPTFRAFLQQVRETTLDAYAHQNVPFEQLVEELRPPRDPSHTPLFQVMFILQNAPVPPQGQRDLEVEYLRVDNGTSKFDLTLSLTEMPDGLRAVAEYKTDLFAEATIERLLGHYQRLLESIVADPHCTLSALSLLTETERQTLLAWNEASRPGSEQVCIHHLFETQAASAPHAIALECDGEQLTYRELNRRANQLAHHLRALNVQPEERIGLCLDRSLELIVGVLGILKAGACYVPLDPNYPQERLRFMVEDAQVSVLLIRQKPTLSDSLAWWFRGTMIDLHADWSQISRRSAANLTAEVAPEQIAYVIYTSGSTGRPKGVLIEHRSLVNYVEVACAAYGITAADRILQFASINYDGSAEEIYTALTSGATLVLRNDRMIETIATFLATCTAWRISLLSLPTTFWHELVAQMDAEALVLPKSLRLVTFGGDRANPERVARWQQHADEHVQLVNTYGPTESTIIATLFCIPPAALDRSLRDVPIGRPLRNLTAYVLDQHLALVPVGVPGELCLGGAGLARGYLDRPALTAERFVPDPFSQRPGARIYHTGDLVRWLPDGTLEFLGRVDYQVKIRGFRIEVGEVEAALHQCPAVSDAVVVAREDTSPTSGYPDKRLVAYIIPRDGHTPTTSELRSFLLAKIPDYMIPTAFITLERLPLTAGGKVNRRVLPAPDRVRPQLNDAFAEPRTPTEQQVAAIWRSVLKLEQVGIDDNFFDLGGHSLLATQVIARLRDMFQVNLPIRYLFAAPTVSGVAAMIERMRWLAQDTKGSAADDESMEEGAL